MRALHARLQREGYADVYHFDSHAAIADFIKKISAADQGREKFLVLLKGSRRMELEKVIGYLKD